MDESESKKEKPKEGRRFSQEQYDMLKRCSEKKDITEWNEWREKNPGEDILLEGAELIKANLGEVDLHSANLEGSKLRGAYLKRADFENAHLESSDLSMALLDNSDLAEAHIERSRLFHAFLRYSTLERAHLKDADLTDARLEGAQLSYAHFERANFNRAHLENADLNHAHLEQAKLIEAHLNNTQFFEAHLERVESYDVHLEGADLGYAYLQCATLPRSHLSGTLLYYAHLEGACFLNVLVDGSTLIWQCKIDRKTDFQGVGLESARIDPGTKQLLKYNIRRKNWEEWYKEHSRIKCLVKPFWWMSDYGLRSWRIIVTFFGLALTFAMVYWLCPTFVMVNGVVGDIRGFWHALYFSVVTMTTLGFGDIAANPDSWGGQTLLMLQVILGYVLLGALVTRFAVLFTAGGPAGRFSNEQEKKGQGEQSAR